MATYCATCRKWEPCQCAPEPQTSNNLYTKNSRQVHPLLGLVGALVGAVVQELAPKHRYLLCSVDRAGRLRSIVSRHATLREAHDAKNAITHGVGGVRYRVIIDRSRA